MEYASTQSGIYITVAAIQMRDSTCIRTKIPLEFHGLTESTDKPNMTFQN